MLPFGWTDNDWQAAWDQAVRADNAEDREALLVARVNRLETERDEALGRVQELEEDATTGEGDFVSGSRHTATGDGHYRETLRQHSDGRVTVR